MPSPKSLLKGDLTLALINAAGVPPAPRKLFDGGGLFLYLSPAGAQVWRLQYRFEGRQQTLTIGPLKLIDIQGARQKALDAKRALLDGIDPNAVKRAVPAVSLSWEEACDTFWNKRKDINAQTRLNAFRGLQMHTFQHLGKRPILAITKADMMVPLKVMEENGLLDYLRKVRGWASLVFVWAEANGYANSNPAKAIAPKAFQKNRVVHRRRLTEREVPDFLQKLDRLIAANQHDTIETALFTKLLLLTWVRTVELREMQWDQVAGDEWCIPGDQMKMVRPFVVALPRQALAIIAQMKRRSSGSHYVFAGRSDDGKKISENAALDTIERLGFKYAQTGHGFRGLGRTWAAKRAAANGYTEQHLEFALSHADDDHDDAYNEYAYLDERRIMLQDYADWVEQQSRPAPTSNVSNIRSAVRS